MICLIDVVVRRNVDYKKEEYLLLKLSKTQRLKEKLIYNYKPIYEKVYQQKKNLPREFSLASYAIGTDLVLSAADWQPISK
jgi:hypothetical protein